MAPTWCRARLVARVSCCHRVHELADSGDLNSHLIAGSEEDRRILPGTDPRRRASGDDISGKQRHCLTDVSHEIRDWEDHVPGIRRLRQRPVDVTLDVQALRVRQLLSRDYPGAEREKAIAALANTQLPCHCGFLDEISFAQA
jgi:hypothetical protein